MKRLAAVLLCAMFLSFIAGCGGGILAGEMLLNFDGLVDGTMLDADYVPAALDTISADAAAAGVRVERLQLDGRPHGFGYQEDWFDAYDSFLTDVFSEE